MPRPRKGEVIKIVQTPIGTKPSPLLANNYCRTSDCYGGTTYLLQPPYGWKGFRGHLGRPVSTMTDQASKPRRT